MKLQNIVYLTRDQFNTLVEEGQVTNASGETIYYDPNTEYRVPKLPIALEVKEDNREKTVCGYAVAEYVKKFIPAAPLTQGAYTLQCIVTGSGPSYFWVPTD